MNNEPKKREPVQSCALGWLSKILCKVPKIRPGIGIVIILLEFCTVNKIIKGINQKEREGARESGGGEASEGTA